MLKTSWIAAFAVTLIFSGPAIGQENERDLADIKCRDVMLSSGNDRDITVMALHAFLMGKANTSKYTVENLAKATDSFLEYCIEYPQKPAIPALEQFVSGK
jgi:hypothetical protein